jgi:RNA polymerase sigma factor for flagellar operon FliA
MPQLAMGKLKRYAQSPPLEFKKKDSGEREQLVAQYAPLVKTIAGRLGIKLPKHISREDLLSAGIMGLLDAIDKYDVEKGVEFKSYAEFRIRGAMLDELRSMDWVPRSVRRNAKRLEQAYAKVEKQKMRAAEDEEVAAELEVDIKTFYTMLDEARGVAIISEEEIGNVLPKCEYSNPWQMNNSARGTNPGESLDLAEVKIVIAEAIDRLPKNERMVVALYYYEELTMKEIGQIMGYTESRVSQLHTKAAIRLRNSLKHYFDVESP